MTRILGNIKRVWNKLKLLARLLCLRTIKQDSHSFFQEIKLFLFLCVLGMRQDL